MEKITFAERLKEARKNAKLTQQQLADIVGRTKSAVSRWESGENTPQLFDLVKIEKAVGVSGQTLMYGTDEIKVTTLSEINRISSKLEEPRQQVVLDTAKEQYKEQESEKKKVIPLENNDNILTEEELQEAVDQAVAFDGKPFDDREKEIVKQLLRQAWEDKHGRG